ncbi:MAG: DNA topoisomerase IV subunit A [Deltaproteobacteria bacterium]|nr:DNA topoisomerase IV subunit A [Deltaproteobacteria bacterium]
MTNPTAVAPTQLGLFASPSAEPARGGSGGSGGAANGDGGGFFDDPDRIPLAMEIQRRYLNYSLSVITSRALPDVRDGLKPVQRRILYSMYNNLHLYPDGRFKKCATVVGDVLGKFHPHGDTAAYDALVRMAQDFSLRYPLIDGQGNFGSLDGDAAAAYRYTEAKLREIATELLSELKQKTTHFRPNFDGTLFEPVVLPARVPNLLVNGATGIAVGMATNIPPHNLGEIVEALKALIEDPELEVKDLVKFVKGPDFPTGGEIVASRSELRAIYETGQGSIKVRGQYEVEEGKRGQLSVIITSIPFAVSKSTIVERIADVIIQRKLPHLVDVRDESTDEVRIVCELKREADPALVMAYLYKNTPLQTTFGVNLTCLVPTENPDVQAPERLDLKKALKHFLDFRFEVVTKRLQHELDELKRRMHILDALTTVYDALDEVIRIIRKSDGKPDAAEKLQARFKFDDEQTEAILELKLWKIAKLEILVIQEELAEKKKEASRIEGVLKSVPKRWTLIGNELDEIGRKYTDKRKTKVTASDEAAGFSAEDFIVHEDSYVIVTKDGWVKRQKEMKDASSTRIREGDSVMAVLFGSTAKPCVFFTNMGGAYVTRINDIPASTGYGEPIQKIFKFEDGERIVHALSLDPRTGIVLPEVKPAAEGEEPAVDPLSPPFMIAVTKKGLGLRFSLLPHSQLSTRKGRTFAKLNENDEVVFVGLCGDKDTLIVASEHGRVLICDAEEVNLLSGAGKGVMAIKIQDDDNLIGAACGLPKEVAMTVETSKGKTIGLTGRSYEKVTRGGLGHEIVKRDTLARVVPAAIVVPAKPDTP